MNNEKLKELGKYADDLEKTEPIELVDKFLKNIDEEINTSSEESMSLGNKFGKEVVRIIDNYKYQGISDIQISYHMLSLLVGYIKSSLVEEKAALLNIDKNLYKKDMHFLFKGKE